MLGLVSRVILKSLDQDSPEGVKVFLYDLHVQFWLHKWFLYSLDITQLFKERITRTYVTQATNIRYIIVTSDWK